MTCAAIAWRGSIATPTLLTKFDNRNDIVHIRANHSNDVTVERDPERRIGEPFIWYWWMQAYMQISCHAGNHYPPRARRASMHMGAPRRSTGSMERYFADLRVI
jgi:hypothetical protein